MEGGLSPGGTAALPGGRRRRKLADQVASLIEGRILDGSLAPGDRLPVEFELAEELSVSRTVVRDAMRALAARGLVDVRQGHGMFVSIPSPQAYADAACTLLARSDCTIGDLWEGRRLLDSAMLSFAIRSERADWSAAEQGLADYATAVERDDPDAAADGHRRFHVGLLTAVRNPVLDLLLGPMHEIIVRTSYAPEATGEPGAWRAGFPEHPPILAAAKRGDEAGLEEAIAKHYAFVDWGEYASSQGQLLRDSPVAREVLLRTVSAPVDDALGRPAIGP
jgi:GntR family transcriptional regulator, transcriptional repressor for pyruvate dehydrogenase complex